MTGKKKTGQPAKKGKRSPSIFHAAIPEKWATRPAQIQRKARLAMCRAELNEFRKQIARENRT